MSSSVVINSNRAELLRGLGFDLTYTVGIGSLALFLGWVVTTNTNLFFAIFVVNAWLLGYHHVVSTFTRLTFDRDSLEQHRFLVTKLPLIVLAGVLVCCLLFGAWILTSVYLYWQWWHYTRQSYGISRLYQRKAGIENDLLRKLVIYALPAWGILHRSYQQPDTFLFAELKVIPVPLWLVVAAGLFTVAVLAWWVAQTAHAWINGNLAMAHTLYVCVHLTVFGVGYLAIDNINHGWLVLNVWHNCQYILTVWIFNQNRFQSGINNKHKFLSYLSQRRNLPIYMGVCLLISTLIYSGLQYSLSWILVVTATSLPLFAIVFQAINFHHYLVDAVIWKVRRKTVSQNLGIRNPESA
jgi:hypothetical protein